MPAPPFQGNHQNIAQYPDASENIHATSRWCSNAAQPDLSTLVKIASLLDVDVKDLINSTKL